MRIGWNGAFGRRKVPSSGRGLWSPGRASGGGATDVMTIELLLFCLMLPQHALLVAFGFRGRPLVDVVEKPGGGGTEAGGGVGGIVAR